MAHRKIQVTVKKSNFSLFFHNFDLGLIFLFHDFSGGNELPQCSHLQFLSLFDSSQMKEL